MMSSGEGEEYYGRLDLLMADAEEIYLCGVHPGDLALHPDRYNPLVMAPELVKAHNALDREVDKALGAPKRLTEEDA